MPAWYDKRKDAMKVRFVVGAFCPIGFRKVDEPYPYLWAYTEGLERFRVKAPDRIRFAQAVRVALGEAAPAWEGEGVDDADQPLGQYLRRYDNASRAKLLLDPDALFAFFTEHLPALFAIAPVIDAELQRLVSQP